MHADIDVVLPAGAPRLTPAGAAGLLRLLLDACGGPDTADEGTQQAGVT